MFDEEMNGIVRGREGLTDLQPILTGKRKTNNRRIGYTYIHRRIFCWSLI